MPPKPRSRRAPAAAPPPAPAPVASSGSDDDEPLFEEASPRVPQRPPPRPDAPRNGRSQPPSRAPPAQPERNLGPAQAAQAAQADPLQKVLSFLDLGKHEAQLGRAGFSCRMCAIAVAEDWEDIGIPAADAVMLRRAARAALGMEPDPHDEEPEPAEDPRS